MLRRNLQTTAKVASILLFALAAMLAQSAQAQTFSVIQDFSAATAAFPYAGLSIDSKGRLYGTTSQGGTQGFDCDGCGVVFRLAPQGSSWILTPLYDFGGVPDGAEPVARPVFAPNGLLYGTTAAGGSGNCEGPGCGTVYGLRPGATACVTALCSWSESLRFSFGGPLAICGAADDKPTGQAKDRRLPTDIGACPGYGDLTFDQAGNIYGTLRCCYGTVYELTPSGISTILYFFAGGADGDGPVSGVIFDQAGNLYGTTFSGGSSNCGTVYELSPNGSGWTKNTLYNFQCGSDGDGPVGGLIFDAAGNLYGTTSIGGAGNGGTVFELTPSGRNWTFRLLYSLNYSGTYSPYAGPSGSLTMDASGSLYGTAVLAGANGYGSVFKLTPSNGGWSYTSQHDFTGGDDGGDPYGNVTFDVSGNIYGTASIGGTGMLGMCEGEGCGVVWEITP